MVGILRSGPYSVFLHIPKGRFFWYAYDALTYIGAVLKHAEGMSLRCDAICTFAYCGRHESSHIIKVHTDSASGMSGMEEKKKSAPPKKTTPAPFLVTNLSNCREGVNLPSLMATRGSNPPSEKAKRGANLPSEMAYCGHASERRSLKRSLEIAEAKAMSLGGSVVARIHR